ncbi:MAG: hypothetical protein ACRENP_22495 [Longimicrobiales bacterium]
MTFDLNSGYRDGAECFTSAVNGVWGWAYSKPGCLTYVAGLHETAQGSGPNTGIWYVKKAKYEYNAHSQILRHFRGLDTNTLPADSAQGLQCRARGAGTYFPVTSSVYISTADFNTSCGFPGSQFGAFLEALWYHEDKHVDFSREEAEKAENNLNALIEDITALSQQDVDSRVNSRHDEVQARIARAGGKVHDWPERSFHIYFFLSNFNEFRIVPIKVRIP